jgi:predicted transcriptional regulator of viral defense system
MFKYMHLTEKQIIARVRAHGRGFVFTTKLFSSITDDSASIRTALTRLVQKKSIRRLSRGLYDLPEVHPQLGEIMPTTQKIIEAIKASDAIEVQPTGAYAANLLGLSTQIPMKIELYTNGPKKTIRIGRQEIILKPTTPKNMIGAGTKAGLILHALKQIGKDNVTDEMIKQIRSKIEKQDIKHIKKQIQFAPVWIAKIMRSLINEN